MDNKPEFLHNTETGGIFKVPDDYNYTTNDYMNNKLRGEYYNKNDDNYNITDYDNNEIYFEAEHQNIMYDNCVKTDEQKRAIADYTTDTGYGGSEIVNRFLNGEKQLGEKATTLVEEKVKIIDSCISERLIKPIYFYRGVELNPEDLKVGYPIPNKGFTSGSIYIEDAKKHGHVIKTKAFAGEKALYIGNKTSHEEPEHEILFGRNHSTIITKITKNNGQYEIEGKLVKE